MHGHRRRKCRCPKLDRGNRGRPAPVWSICSIMRVLKRSVRAWSGPSAHARACNPCLAWLDRRLCSTHACPSTQRLDMREHFCTARSVVPLSPGRSDPSDCQRPDERRIMQQKRLCLICRRRPQQNSQPGRSRTYYHSVENLASWNYAYKCSFTS
jgi:hypothetical protein